MIRTFSVPSAALSVLAILAIATVFPTYGDRPGKKTVEPTRATPWPLGRPPSTVELQELVADAIELHDRERSEEFLEAMERGEASEHIFLLQTRIDSGALDNDALFVFGDGLFEHTFRSGDGYGDTPSATLRRVHLGVRGGLDTFSCNGCHSVGGPNGAGSFSQNAFVEGDGKRIDSTNPRNPPALQGVGLVQALAAEASRELQGQRASALAEAAASGEPVTTELHSKGVSFGRLTAGPDGGIETGQIQGIDPDLVVRPFGWKGDVVNLRRFVEVAARIHFGIQSHPSTQRHRVRPEPRKLGEGADWFDPDNDGKQRELEEGSLTATAVYLAMLESPAILPPRDPGLLERWARGSETFDTIGCHDCHRRTLKLYRKEWEEHPDTTGAPPVRLRLLQDGDHPKSPEDVELFSDLKRHDMGRGLADRNPNALGIPRSQFLTRPLWGLAESAPYLHDGRAATIPEAIEAHGGEAAEARNAFLALDAGRRADLHVFLLSLTRQPKVRIVR